MLIFNHFTWNYQETLVGQRAMIYLLHKFRQYIKAHFQKKEYFEFDHFYRPL
jgi:hypothetical protein